MQRPFAAALLAALDPITLRWARQQERQRARAEKRQKRSASYPYCGARQRARYARQIREGRLKVENGLVA